MTKHPEVLVTVVPETGMRGVSTRYVLKYSKAVKREIALEEVRKISKKHLKDEKGGYDYTGPLGKEGGGAFGVVPTCRSCAEGRSATHDHKEWVMWVENQL